MTTYTILTSALNDFTKKINRIAKKCDKQGIPYTFIVKDSYDKVVTLEKGEKFIINLTDVELDIQFKFNGWKSLGMIQRKDGITQCYLHSQELIQQYCDTDFHCDHCHKHVRRNSVVVLEHENGTRKVVGTSCVNEFTCGLDGNLIAAFHEIEAVLTQKNDELAILLQGESLDGIPVSSFCEQNGRPVYEIERVVSCAIRLINSYGFEPSNSYCATWKQISSVYKTITEIEPEAIKAITWIKSLSREEFTQSSYLFNLRQIIDADYCTLRHFGLLASLVPAYRKAETKRLQKASNVESHHVGNAGEKLSLILTYINSFSYESPFGTGYFHIFSDKEGNIFKWSTNKSLNVTIAGQMHSLDRGATISLKGTVKEHDEYRGVKQTLLTRCKYEIISSNLQHEIEKEHEETTQSTVDTAMTQLMSQWG